MNIVGPDVSFYQDNDDTPRGIDFVTMASAAKFVIIRAGQNTWIDPDFATNWQAAKQAGLPRGSYWFYDSRQSPLAQAAKWVEALGADQGELPLFADYEESYGGAYNGWRNFKAFLEELRKLGVTKEIFIYTAYWYWKDNGPNPLTDPAELEYFHQYPLWIANYGTSAPAVPVPWAKDEWTFWQYTENGDGRFYGAESTRIDLNYFNGDDAAFRERFSLETVPEGDVVKPWWGGAAEYTKGFRDLPGTPFYFHTVKFKRSVVKKVHVNGLGMLRTGMSFFETRADPVLGPPDLVVNGDEGSPGTPKAIVVSDGVIEKRVPSETSVQWDKFHKIIGIGWFALPGVYNAHGGSNILIQDGLIPDGLDNVSVDPRMSLFWNDEFIWIICIDGRNNGTLGLTRLELARFGASLGATNGHNHDGGDSNTLLKNVDGRPIGINNPPEGFYHQLSQFVGIWLDKDAVPPEPPVEGEKMFEVVVQVPMRVEPNFYANRKVDVEAFPNGDMPIGLKFESLEEVADTKPVEGSRQVMWHRNEWGGWVPANHHTKDIVYLRSDVVVPPVDPPVVGPNITVKVDGYKQIDAVLEPE